MSIEEIDIPVVGPDKTQDADDHETIGGDESTHAKPDTTEEAGPAPSVMSRLPKARSRRLVMDRHNRVRTENTAEKKPQSKRAAGKAATSRRRKTNEGATPTDGGPRPTASAGTAREPAAATPASGSPDNRPPRDGEFSPPPARPKRTNPPRSSYEHDQGRPAAIAADAIRVGIEAAALGARVAEALFRRIGGR